MKYQLDHPYAREGAALKAYVLGAREGSGNIGDAVARRLAVEGWIVFCDDGAVGDGSRPPGGNLNTDDVAEQHGYTVTDKGRYQRFEAPAVSDFERADADALIITLGKTAKTHFAEINDWDVGQMIRANLTLPLEAARRYVQATGPKFGERGFPAEEWKGKTVRHIIFVGSYAHEHPFTNGTLYCAAKAGLAMAARTLGWELTDLGYRVHIIHPYHVPGTPMWAEVERGVMESKGWTREQAEEYASKDLKMPHPLMPEEVAEVVEALLTVPALGWLSGQGLNLYGGSR
jgi:NAD(P)-dependent dehydrogenase (short-subunit alcohol dehydrogenase family)